MRIILADAPFWFFSFHFNSGDIGNLNSFNKSLHVPNQCYLALTEATERVCGKQPWVGFDNRIQEFILFCGIGVVDDSCYKLVNV